MKRHAIMMLCYNNLALTQEALASIVGQDIGSLDIRVVNNGSTDGTEEYLATIAKFMGTISVINLPTNESPVRVANQVMADLFSEYDKVLGVANDVILPFNYYRLANEWPRGIVCGSQSDKKDFTGFDKATVVSECTPMAVMLTRKWVYDALLAKDGYFFDEGYFHYASDCDLALRIAACGIRGVQLDVQYFHFGSSSWVLASEQDKVRQLEHAGQDRAYFSRKWGFAVDAFEYGQCAVDINWRAVPK